MKKVTLFSFLFAQSTLAFSQENTYYLNANQALSYLNPSFAGSNGFARNQSLFYVYKPNSGSRNTLVVNTFDTYIKPLRGGIAVSYLYEDVSQGVYKTSGFSVTYAQHISLMDKKLKIVPSLQFSQMMRRLDLNRYLYADLPVSPPDVNGFVWNPQYLPLSERAYNVLNAGLLVNFGDFYGGISYRNINQPDVGLNVDPQTQIVIPDRVAPVLGLYVSHTLMLGDKNMLQLATRYDDNGTQRSIRFSTNAVLFNHLIAGAGFVSTNVLLTNLGYRHNYLSLTVGYNKAFDRQTGDMPESWLASLSFNLRNKDNRKVLTAFESW